MLDDVEKTAKNIWNIFSKTQSAVAFAILLTFHITLALGDYTNALNQIFPFFYDSKNNDIIELIRNFLLSLIVLAWLFYNYIQAKYWIYFDKLLKKANPNETESEKADRKNYELTVHESFAKQLVKVENSFWIFVFIKYFIDILDYHELKFEFVYKVLGQIWVYLIICITITIIRTVFCFLANRCIK